MKTVAPLLVVLGTLVLSACATMPPEVASVSLSDVDVQKVNLVNDWARRNGVVVVWVNYPQRAGSTTQ
jgi:starvation-inducible outer membrane lipoprotein